MRNFLEQLRETFQIGLVVFAMFLVCLGIVLGVGYSIFGGHDMVWLRVVGVVVLVFLLGLGTRV